MEHMRRWMRRLLYPSSGAAIACAAATAALLGLLFGLGLFRGTTAAYGIYLFSAYSLTVCCIRLGRWLGGVALPGLKRLEPLRRLRADGTLRAGVSLGSALLLNLLVAAVKLISGVWYGSLWLISLGIYYLCLLCMRCLLAHYLRSFRPGENLAAEYRRCRICGVIMALMTLALTGVVALAVRQDASIHAAGVLIYGLAMYAFYAVASACVSLARGKGRPSPVLAAARVIRLAAALVSMLSLEAAMLTRFDQRESPLFRQVMLGASGAVVCLAVLLMACFMMFRANRALHRLRAAPRAGAAGRGRVPAPTPSAFDSAARPCYNQSDK